ncbi:D-alanine transaminase [Melghiribacillus thermohalophilus]|uniref:D-alanine aminotransferase n=1 Tax=Melghiribacillus thermohalophilus TaxID=1324956 RepID=A0A4R3N0B2_9BACI|nr:D-amino-acid transaminase [Melghiribacillus thermohalophilus]TCT22438.1 D-alanine transaminase [Melghiribacillus thermohalophilus]
MYVWVNQELVERDRANVDLEDRGYQFGDGVYEVIRMYHGNFFMLQEHLDRLQYSLNEVGIPFNVKEHQVENKLKEIMKKNYIRDGAVYLQITRGAAPRNHGFPEHPEPVFTAYPLPVTRPHQEQLNGIRMTLVEDLRWLRCDIKSLNLLWNVIAKQKAKERGCFETLFYRNENHVTEGSSSNFFGVKNGVLITHPANSFILNGITRQAVLNICKEKQIPCEEKVMSLNDLKELDEAFITSTTAEVLPVKAIDDIRIGDGSVGPITRRIQKLFFERT